MNLTSEPSPMTDMVGDTWNRSKIDPTSEKTDSTHNTLYDLKLTAIV